MTEPEDQVDFSPVDPTADADHFDEVVRRISIAASAELANRRARHNVVGEIARWHKPLMAAAAASAALLAFTLTGSDTSMSSSADELQQSVGIAEAIGIPPIVATWVRDDVQPSIDDLYTLEQQ